jgi:hypothetical protein
MGMAIRNLIAFVGGSVLLGYAFNDWRIGLGFALLHVYSRPDK